MEIYTPIESNTTQTHINQQQFKRKSKQKKRIRKENPRGKNIHSRVHMMMFI